LNVRNIVGKIINKRREANIIDQMERQDLLAILLKDPLFNKNDEVMIDELLTVFFAGS